MTFHDADTSITPCCVQEMKSQVMYYNRITGDSRWYYKYIWYQPLDWLGTIFVNRTEACQVRPFTSVINMYFSGDRTVCLCCTHCPLFYKHRVWRKQMLMVLNGHDLISPIDVSSLRSQQVMGFCYVGGRKEWSIEVSQPTTTREKVFP